MGWGGRRKTIYFFIYVILGMGSQTLVRGFPIVTPSTTPAETCLGSPGLGPLEQGMSPRQPASCQLGPPHRHGVEADSRALTQGLTQVL